MNLVVELRLFSSSRQWDLIDKSYLAQLLIDPAEVIYKLKLPKNDTQRQTIRGSTALV